MNLKVPLISLLLSSLLLGCGGTPAEIKQVQDRPVEDLKAGADTKPIQLSKVVVKLKRGDYIGAWETGLLCVPHGNLTWKGGQLRIDSDEFTDAFKEELEKYSFKTVGDTNALFEDPSTWKAEILIGGLIKELKANICYPKGGFGDFGLSKGEAYIKVDWQIYSKLDRTVVHSVSTEGAARTDETVGGGDTLAVLNAFAQATHNLLADTKFREIVSRGGEAVKETYIKSGESIVISIGGSKPVGRTPEDWPNAVVTVFAGPGHGSGFVISDNLIMTNYHVVREAESVTIKFNNGLQLVGKVIASNSGRDVALVKVDATLPEHFRLNRIAPKIGDDVYAIGSPLSEKLDATMSRGIISGFREEQNGRIIQSDVNIQHGSSGGPLVDKTGSVVGIAVSGFFIHGAPMGINFFIPIDDALKSLGAI